MIHHARAGTSGLFSGPRFGALLAPQLRLSESARRFVRVDDKDSREEITEWLVSALETSDAETVSVRDDDRVCSRSVNVTRPAASTCL